MGAPSPRDRPRREIAGLDPTVQHVGVLLTGSAAGLDLDDVEVEDAELTGLALDASRVTRWTLVDATVRSVSLVETDLSDGRWERVTVEGSRWAGCVVDGSTWEDVTATDVRALRLSARQVTWRRVRFTDCDLTGLDLSGARLDGVRFDRCTMPDTEFAGATVKRADFAECDLSGVRTVASLRGATVDQVTLTSMAPAMAAGLGVRLAQPR